MAHTCGPVHKATIAPGRFKILFGAPGFDLVKDSRRRLHISHKMRERADGRETALWIISCHVTITRHTHPVQVCVVGRGFYKRATTANG